MVFRVGDPQDRGQVLQGLIWAVMEEVEVFRRVPLPVALEMLYQKLEV